MTDIDDLLAEMRAAGEAVGWGAQDALDKAAVAIRTLVAENAGLKTELIDKTLDFADRIDSAVTLGKQAVAENERLVAQVADLTEALQPFAALAEHWDDATPDDADAEAIVRVGQLRHARRALSTSPATGGRDEAKRVVRIAYPEPGADLADEIVDLIYSLGARYRANATFVMNSKTAGVLRMVHDCDGRFLWSDAPTKGEPARLVGYPVRIDEGIPDIAFGIVAALRAEPPARDGGDNG